MATKIVLTVKMRCHLVVIPVSMFVTRHISHVTIQGASLGGGVATMMMIVEMVVTNEAALQGHPVNQNLG